MMVMICIIFHASLLNLDSYSQCHNLEPYLRVCYTISNLCRLVSQGCKLVGCGSAVPTLEITNDELAKIVDTSDEWINVRTGIRKRRVLSG